MTVTIDDINLSSAGDGLGDKGRAGGVKLQTSLDNIKAAIEQLQGRHWEFNNTGKTLVLGDRILSQIHAGITHTLPATFTKSATTLSDIWVWNTDPGQDVNIDPDGTDEIYITDANQGAGVAVPIPPGTLAIITPRADDLRWNMVVFGSIRPDTITFTELLNGVGFDIIAKVGSGAGDYGSLVCGVDGVLRRSGSGNLAFGSLVTNNIGNAAITLAKMASLTDERIIGRVSGAGTPEALTKAQVLTMLNVADGADVSPATKFTASLSVEFPTNTDDITIAFVNAAITLSEIRFVLVGDTSPSVTCTIRHSTVRNGAGNIIDTNTITSVSSGSDITAISDATIPADSFIWVEITAVSGNVEELHISPIGTYD